MKNFARIAVLSATVIATSLASVGTADAWKRYPKYRGHHNRHVVIGAAALTAGVIIGSTMARPRYVRPRTVIIDRGPTYMAPDVVDIDPGYADEPLYDRPDYSDDQVYGDPDNQGYDQGYEQDGYRQDDQGEDPAYYPPAPRRHASQDQRQDQQAGNLEPWSAEWKAFCSERYRTFNSRTGTYRGVDGRDHFCTAG